MKTRTKITRVLKKQISNENKYISREKLVMETYNYDVKQKENYTTPPAGWKGYRVLATMRNNEKITSTPNGCSYFIKNV